MYLLQVPSVPMGEKAEPEPYDEPDESTEV
jgi:hypothetical protein